MPASPRTCFAVAFLAIVSVAASMTAGALMTRSKADLSHPAAASADGGPPDAATIIARVEALEKRLAAQPDDLEGWKMLGRSFMALDRLKEAVGAWSRAAQLAPSDPDVRAALAQLMDLARQRGAHDEASSRPGG